MSALILQPELLVNNAHLQTQKCDLLVYPTYTRKTDQLLHYESANQSYLLSVCRSNSVTIGQDMKRWPIVFRDVGLSGIRVGK